MVACSMALMALACVNFSGEETRQISAKERYSEPENYLEISIGDPQIHDNKFVDYEVVCRVSHEANGNDEMSLFVMDLISYTNDDVYGLMLHSYYAHYDRLIFLHLS